MWLHALPPQDFTMQPSQRKLEVPSLKEHCPNNHSQELRTESKNNSPANKQNNQQNKVIVNEFDASFGSHPVCLLLPSTCFLFWSWFLQAQSGCQVRAVSGSPDHWTGIPVAASGLNAQKMPETRIKNNILITENATEM